MYQKYSNSQPGLSKAETGVKRKSFQVDVDANPTEDTDVPTDEDVLSSNHSKLDVASLRSSARRWKMAVQEFERTKKVVVLVQFSVFHVQLFFLTAYSNYVVILNACKS